MILRLQFLAVVLWIMVTVSVCQEGECPVCERIVRATIDLGKSQGLKSSVALGKYCDMESLPIEDQKFCYNIDNVRKELFRLLDLGADAKRVCKKVKSMNPDFCKVKTVEVKPTGLQVNERFKRGVIYE